MPWVAVLVFAATSHCTSAHYGSSKEGIQFNSFFGTPCMCGFYGSTYLHCKSSERVFSRVLLISERVRRKVRETRDRGLELQWLHFSLGQARVGAEHGEQGGEQEEAVDEAQHDHQEDNLAKGARDIAGHEHEGNDAQHRGAGAL